MDFSFTCESPVDFVEGCLMKSNRLIQNCNLPIPKVTSLNDLNSKLFVLLFESICSVPLRDFNNHPKTILDEAHNVQTIVDTLSLDLLGMSMSHINGEDIVSGRALSIYNLLEILEGCLHFSKQSCGSSSSKLMQEVSITESEPTRDANFLFCPSCNYKILFDDFSLRKTKNFSYACPVCESQLTLHDSKICCANKWRYHNLSDSSKFSQSQTFSYFEYDQRLNLIPDLKSSKGSDVPLIQPTLIESNKLRPELVRAGVRDSKETGDKTTVPLSSNGVFCTNTISKKYITQQSSSNLSNITEISSLSSSGSIQPFNTVVFRGVSSHVKGKELNEKPKKDKGPLLTERRLSRSLDDVRCFQIDQSVQTSDSLLLNGNENLFECIPHHGKHSQNYQMKNTEVPLQRKTCLKEKTLKIKEKSSSPLPHPKSGFNFRNTRRRSASSSPVRTKSSLTRTKKTFEIENNTLEKKDGNYNKGYEKIQEYIKERRMKSQKQIQAEEAAKRKQILLSILQKEADCVQCLSREASSSRSKNGKKISNEQIKSIFGKCFILQDDEILLLRELLEGVIEKENSYRQVDLTELENIYQTQYPLLIESLALERCDEQERIKTQRRVLKLIREEITEKKRINRRN